MRASTTFLLATLLVVPGTAAAQQPPPVVPGVYTCVGALRGVAQLTQAEADGAMECVINAERAARGIPAYPHSPVLALAALTHSQDMLAKGYFSHTSSDGSSGVDRISRAAQTLGSVYVPKPAGENALQTELFMSPRELFLGYFASGGHCINMFSRPYGEMGSGTAFRLDKSGATVQIKNTLDFGNAVPFVATTPELQAASDFCMLEPGRKPAAEIVDPTYVAPEAPPSEREKASLSIAVRLGTGGASKGTRQRAVRVKARVEDAGSAADLPAGVQVRLLVQRWYGKKKLVKQKSLVRFVTLDPRNAAHLDVAITRNQDWQMSVTARFVDRKTYGDTASVGYLESRSK